MWDESHWVTNRSKGEDGSANCALWRRGLLVDQNACGGVSKKICWNCTDWVDADLARCPSCQMGIDENRRVFPFGIVSGFLVMITLATIYWLAM
jgi:hypothetical protein